MSGISIEENYIAHKKKGRMGRSIEC